MSITIGTVNEEPILGVALDGVAEDVTEPVAAAKSGANPIKVLKNNIRQVITINL